MLGGGVRSSTISHGSKAVSQKARNMKKVYLAAGWAAAGMAVVGGIAHVAVRLDSVANEESLLRGIGVALYFLIALVAFGNADRVSKKS